MEGGNARLTVALCYSRESRARSEHVLLVQELSVAGICAQRLQPFVDTQTHAVGHSPARAIEPRESGIGLAKPDVGLGDVDSLKVDLRPPLD